MDNLNQSLRQLVAMARTQPPKTLARQRTLNQLYRLVMKSGKLWKESTLYYNDALQQMWEYCCQNLAAYNPSEKEVITWLDDELKKRLRRFRYAQQKQQERHLTVLPTEAGDVLDPCDTIKATSDIQPLLELWEKTLAWVKTDPEGILQKTCFRNRPEINCQILFLLRFPEETSWKMIADRFELTTSEAKDLPKWYNRCCLPLLRNFGVSQGYLEER